MTLRCPVCWRDTHVPDTGRVRRHRDTAGHLCPMSGRSIPGAAFICPSNDVHVRIACA